MKVFKDLFKHSGIYALGQILTRVASVLLLPLYTHCLSTEDYGVTAILDLTAAILSLVIGGGMAAAVTRFHYEYDGPGSDAADGATESITPEQRQHYDRVWWTGLAYVAFTSLIVVMPMWIGRQWLADVTLGDISGGGWFYTLTLANVWFYCVGYVGDTYMRVRKWSGLFGGIALVRLLINIGLNVWLLVFREMGVEGLLIGNLVSTILQSLTMVGVLLWTRGKPSFSKDMLVRLLRFGAPVILTALLAMLMHEVDRLVLRALVSMGEVGVYSLAHKIGFAIETLCLLPFVSIWSVSMYEVAERPDAERIYALVYRYFVYGFGILLLGAALTVHPILPWLTPDAYGRAIDQIAVVLLGFFFFGLHILFEVPAMLKKRTMLMVPAAVAGVIMNIEANFVLVPMWGGFGAGWAGVMTYIVYSAIGLILYRRIMKIEYEWGRTSAAIVGFCLTYVAMRYYCFPMIGDGSESALAAVLQTLLSIVVCAAWAGILMGGQLRDYLQNRRAAKTPKVPNDVGDVVPPSTPELLEQVTA